MSLPFNPQFVLPRATRLSILPMCLMMVAALCVMCAAAPQAETKNQEKKSGETSKEAASEKEAKAEQKKPEQKKQKDSPKKETKGKDQEKGKQVKSERDLLFDPSKATTKKKKDAKPRKPVPIDFSVKGTKELTFDNMIFNIKPDEAFQIKQLTKDLIKLRKHKIRIRGYIQPGFRQNNIKKFILVRDNQDCCFGPGAALYDCMIVTLAKGQSTSFSVRPITVEGTFLLKPFRGVGNKVEAILQLKDAKVK